MPDFHSLYSHDFARVAVAVPQVRVADPRYNAEQTVALAQQAVDEGAVLVLFPELGLSAYSNDDLFHQDALQDATRAALATVLEASEDMGAVLLVGAALRFGGSLYNCAVYVLRGRHTGAYAKTVPSPTTASSTRSANSRAGGTPTSPR